MEAMIDGIWEPDADRLKSCYEEIIRINKMVGDLEKLAKYESEGFVLDKTVFDMSALIRRIICNFEPNLKITELKLPLKVGLRKFLPIRIK